MYHNKTDIVSRSSLTLRYCVLVDESSLLQPATHGCVAVAYLLSESDM